MSSTIVNKVTRYRYVILLVVWLLYLINYIDRISVLTFLPYIGKDLYMSATQMGWLSSIFFVGYAAAQVSAGFTADRIGPKKTMSIAIFTFTLVTFVTGFVRTFGQFIVLRIALAVGEGHHYTPAVKTLATWFPLQEKGRAFGWFTTSWSVAPAITPLIVTWLAATFFAGSWRPVFFLMAFPGVIGIFILYKYIYDSPKEMFENGKVSAEEYKLISEEAGGDLHGHGSGDVKYSTKIFSRDPVFYLFCFAWFAHLMVYWGMTTWISTFLVKQHSLNIKTMGLYAALPYFMAFISQNLGGWLQDKVFHGKIRWICMIAFLGCVPVMYFLGNVPKGQNGLLLLALALGGFFVTLASSSINSFPALRYPKEIVGAATGISNGFGQLGSFVSPVVAGYIIVTLPNGNFDFTNVFIFWAVASLISGIAMYFLNETPREAEEYVI
jgi:sugar phosphate permease